MILVKDVVWLAGLLEGEACFSLIKRKRGRVAAFPFIQLDMQDRDVVERAAMLMGSPAIEEIQHRTARAKSYRFRVSGYRAAGWMMTLFSLLGARRRARIKDVLTAWKNSQARASRLYRRDTQ